MTAAVAHHRVTPFLELRRSSSDFVVEHIFVISFGFFSSAPEKILDAKPRNLCYTDSVGL
jgi:hypothetical protein